MVCPPLASSPGRVAYGDRCASLRQFMADPTSRQIGPLQPFAPRVAGGVLLQHLSRSIGILLHVRANLDPRLAPTPFFVAVATARSDPAGVRIIPLFQLYTALLDRFRPAIQHLADVLQAAVPQLRRLHRRATASIFFREPLVPPLHHPFCFNGIGLHGAVLDAILIELRGFRSLVHPLYFGKLFRPQDADADLPTFPA